MWLCLLLFVQCCWYVYVLPLNAHSFITRDVGREWETIGRVAPDHGCPSCCDVVSVVVVVSPRDVHASQVVRVFGVHFAGVFVGNRLLEERLFMFVSYMPFFRYI